MAIYLKTVLLSMHRRKKDILFVSLATFIVVLFMSSVSLFQDAMNRYFLENNYKNYGEWILSATGTTLKHPYFSITGDCNTGLEILDEKGLETGNFIGSVDGNFLELSNLSFYEGRLPEAENEIVMTLSSLSELGYSYDLGQRIHIAVGEENFSAEKEFVLVGTIKDFARNWKYNDGYYLPSGIVTEQALMDMGGVRYTTHFYQLDRAYEDIDAGEFIEPFVRSSSKEAPVEYNSYVYDNQLWDSNEMFQNLKLVLIVIAVLVVSYLMMSYVTGRRSWYYQLRSTGASKRQICIMIILEGAYGTLPWAFAGLILPYIVGAGICYSIARMTRLPNFFCVDVQNLMWQIVSILGIIAISVITACLISGDRRLGSNVHEVTGRQLKRLRRIVKKRRNLALTFQKRQNRMRPFGRLATILFSVTVCGFLLFCMHRLSKEYVHYKFNVNLFEDFSASKSTELMQETVYLFENENGELEETSGMSGGTTQIMYAGMSPEMEAQLNIVDGIKKIYKSATDTEHYPDWQDRVDSPIFQHFEKVKEEQRIIRGEPIDQEKAVVTYFHENYQQALEMHGSLIEKARVDQEAFQQGKQVLVLLGEGKLMNSPDIFRETTLQSGETITLMSTGHPGRVPVEAEVLSLTTDEIYENVTSPHLAQNYMQPYTIIASSALARKMAAADGKLFQYNEIIIDFSANSSFVSTTKRLASLFSENGFKYSSGWEEKTMAREAFISRLSVYGALICVILSTYLLLQMNLIRMKNYERANKFTLLKRLGMSDSFYIKMAVKVGIKDALWLLPGIPLGYGLFFMMEWLELDKKSIPSTWSSWIGDYTTEPLEIVMGNIMDNTSLIYVVFFVLLLMLGVIGIAYFSAKKQTAMNIIKKL